MISPETWKLRQQVLQKYGGRCTCACGCRTEDLQLLQLHHTSGGGSQERKHVRGNTYYTRLLKADVDPELTALCVNCHWLETMFGTCHLGLSLDEQIANEASLTGGQSRRRQELLQPGVKEYPWTHPGGWLVPDDDVQETPASPQLTPTFAAQRRRFWPW